MITDGPVLVVGDAMLDRTWFGGAARLSPEAPVPVVRPERILERVGGAANVAANLTALGVPTTLLGWRGDDADGQRLEELLAEAGITSRLLVDGSRPTTVKLRVVAGGQQVVRVDFERDHPADRERLRSAFAALHADHVGLALSDYGKGGLPSPADLYGAGLPCVVDPKHPDPGHYAGPVVLKPNAELFRRWTGDLGSLQERARALRARLGAAGLVVSLGSDGLAVVDADGAFAHFPAQAKTVFDVTGAGDTVLAVLAAGLAAGTPLAACAELANRAGAQVVGELGTATIDRSRLLGDGDPLPAIADARAGGARVVFTNGCFDVLHAGHVHLLQRARALGDRLVVGLNSDDSVRRLKGPGRPVNPLPDRAAVLRALACVDWVLPFDGFPDASGWQDTPLRLIEALRPDVLVKGADYEEQDIVGAEIVRGYGGDVVRVRLLEGRSTTAILGG